MRTETRHWIWTEQNHCVLRGLSVGEARWDREAREGRCAQPTLRETGVWERGQGQLTEKRSKESR